MLNITGQNFIAGQRSSAGSKFVLSYDAATDEALPYQFAQATPEEIDQAAQAAALAYPAFRQTTPEQRAVFLETIASEIDALDDQFIATVCQGKRQESLKCSKQGAMLMTLTVGQG
ncbi:hypothetical protein A7A47_16010 [Acinetobacter baumannii]|nr:hypothetical protein A7A47_16010 [Acinetobacter baumannii]